MEQEFDLTAPVFSIGVVARIVGVHQQTVRNYERAGLLTPKRTRGGTRRYSQRNLQQIQKIHEWTTRLGVNRAGIEVMLSLMKRIEELERQLEELRGTGS